MSDNGDSGEAKKTLDKNGVKLPGFPFSQSRETSVFVSHGSVL
jgi:hypothetical protein